jgi:dienelactone hydrolase
MLLFWGGLDTRITRHQARAIVDAMTEAKKMFVNVESSDADHGFFLTRAQLQGVRRKAGLRAFA